LFEIEGIAAPSQVVDNDDPIDVRTDKEKGHDVAGCNQGHGDALIRMAVAAIARNLPDIEHRQLHLGMLARVSHELVGNLPGGSNSPVG